MANRKPVIHGDDHLHGHADPARTAWESVGGGGGGGSGIQFDTDNEGGYLFIRANDPYPGSGRGIDIRDNSGGGLKLEVEAGGNAQLLADTGNVDLFSDSGDINIGTTSGGVFVAVAVGGNGISLVNDSTGNTLITADDTSGFVQLRAGSNVDITVANGGSGYLRIFGLPIVNPGGTARVWNDGGVLTIT